MLASCVYTHTLQSHSLVDLILTCHTLLECHSTKHFLQLRLSHIHYRTRKIIHFIHCFTNVHNTVVHDRIHIQQQCVLRIHFLTKKVEHTLTKIHTIVCCVLITYRTIHINIRTSPSETTRTIDHWKLFFIPFHSSYTTKWIPGPNVFR